MKIFIKRISFLFILLLNCYCWGQQSEMALNTNKWNTNFKINDRVEKMLDSLPKTGHVFRLVAEKISPQKYAVYIQNNYRTAVPMPLQNDKVKILQEALDTDSIWRPIEYWGGSPTQTIFRTIQMTPSQVIQTLTPAYSGIFRTKIRFKLSTNGRLYYSPVVEGNLNRNMFILPDNISSIWPLPMAPKNTPKELKENVIYLEPNAVDELFGQTEKPKKVKKKKKKKKKKQN